MIGVNKIDWEFAKGTCIFSELNDYINTLESKQLEDIEYKAANISDQIYDRLADIDGSPEHDQEVKFFETVTDFFEEVQEIIYCLCDCNTWIEPLEDN